MSLILLPAFSLIFVATTWGAVWFPYRLLESAGLSGALASLLTYLLGLPFLLWLYRRPLARWLPAWRRLVGLALVVGWTNLSYVLAVIDGEVLRVMLLFYLAPLWTLFFAWWFLGERPSRRGVWILALALAGALVMLYRGGLPLPANYGEWLGLGSGIGFALSNVLSRRVRDIPDGVRGVWVYAGVAVVSLPPSMSAFNADTLMALSVGQTWWMLSGISALLILATLSVQFGLARMAANRAIVILLIELPVVALTGWWWAGEAVDLQEWLGAGLILLATLMSLKHGHH